MQYYYVTLFPTNSGNVNVLIRYKKIILLMSFITTIKTMAEMAERGKFVSEEKEMYVLYLSLKR